MIIAVDGPAASGKGTLARALAGHYGLAYLDTGSLYRAVAIRLSREGTAAENSQAAATAAAAITARDLDDENLRTEETGKAASIVATFPLVRGALLDFQRRFASDPPDGAAGAVLDGRDIGTVVLPEAEHKIFVTASREVRARRRFLELRGSAEAPSESAVRTALTARDRQDEERSVSPMAPAPDTHLLDTTELDIDAAFLAAKAYISGSGR